MMGFTSGEILLSLLYSVIYGVIFFVFYTAISLLEKQIEALKLVPQSIIRYDKILENPIKMRGRNIEEQGTTIIVVSIVTFFAGLVLLCYTLLTAV